MFLTYIFPKLGAFPLLKPYLSNSNMSFIKAVYLNKNFMKLPKAFLMIIQKGYSTEKKLAIIGVVRRQGCGLKMPHGWL